MLDFCAVHTISLNPGLVTVLFASLPAFVLSMLVAFTCERTFRGLSYYHNYVQSPVLSAIVASTVMLAIGDRLARGLGMIGALAIERFRTNFKDSRHIIFMFAALPAGIGCGANAYKVAMIGTIAFCVTASLPYYLPSVGVILFDGHRFGLKRMSFPKYMNAVQEVIKRETLPVDPTDYLSTNQRNFL